MKNHGQQFKAILWIGWAILALCSLAACSGCDGGGAAGDPSPEAELPIFQRPFEEDYPNSWPFDHDVPVGYRKARSEGLGSPGVLSFRGEVVDLFWGEGRGHDGYDWVLPEGTPVLAVAGGTVIMAGPEPPADCPGKGLVSALVIQLRHEVPDGPVFDSLYAHLSRIDVAAGETVSAGQPIGLSGNTGCSSGPHLHFSVYRRTGTTGGRPAVVDPYGWEGDFPDPWAVHPDGATSVRLWIDGEAPPGDFSF